MNTGQRIKMLREEKGLTLEELGEMVGVGKSTVRKWENGIIANMKRDKIAAVAKALDVSAGYIMGYEDNLNEDNAILVIKIMADKELINHIRMLSELNEEHKEKIFNDISYWYSKEGH